MSVVIVESADHDGFLIGLVVSIGVLEKNEIVSERNKHAMLGDFETHWDVDFVYEGDLPVSTAIVVGVLEDEDFVIGQRSADLMVGIGTHATNPKPAVVVECHL